LERQVPTLREFSTIFLETSKLRNKPSTIDSKIKILKWHLLPLIGDMRLDEITYTTIEDLKLALASQQVKRPRRTPADGVRPNLSPKTVNKSLMVLHRMLVVARKRRLIDFVPDFEWLRAPLGEFDFLDFDESKRLIAAAEGQLRTMLPMHPTMLAASMTRDSPSSSNASPRRRPCARVSTARRPIKATGIGYFGSLASSAFAICADSASAMLSV
jgi:hypothetical protein